MRQPAAAAVRAGLRPEQRRRGRPLALRGVGKGGDTRTHNCLLIDTLLHAEGRLVTCTFDTRTVPGSQLPALLGLNAARESRMNIDATRNAIYMAGPGDYDLMRALPPGTQQFNCVLAPSGNLMLPCAELQNPAEQGHRGRLRLTPELALPAEVMSEATAAAEVPQETMTRAVAYEAPH